jgi:beta-lactam-binding protein with PASTA domain
MGTGKVILITAITSIIVSTGTFFTLRALVVNEEGVVVPPLTGLRTVQARKLLEAKGLMLMVTEQREDPKVAEGLIASQVPMEGSKVKPGAEVRVVVSKGSSQVPVPPLANLTVAAATQVLASAGLKVGPVTRQPDDKVQKDQIVSSTPASGAQAAKGSAITLILSDGPAGVEVPKVVMQGVWKAKKELEEAGFKVKVTYTYDEDRPPGIVLRQSPEAGAKAAKESEVELIANEND